MPVRMGTPARALAATTSPAFSILSMGLLALAMVTITENVYVNVALSLVVTFGYYTVFMIGATLGQKGILPPWIGAWLANLLFCTLAGGRLAWTARPQRVRAAEQGA